MTANSVNLTNVQIKPSKRKNLLPQKVNLPHTATLEEIEPEKTLPSEKFIIHPKEALLQALGLMPISVNIFNNDETEPTTNEKQIALQCQECKEYFKTQTSLRKHCAEDHRIPLIYYCKFCTILFKTHSDLQAHKDEAHSGQKPYTCTLCPLSFISLETLTAHIRRHNGKAPYTCKICERGFDLFKEYKAHKSVHELVKVSPVRTSEKKYACKICERSFRKPCDLQRHIRVHTGEKPYACSVCGNRFQQGHNLTKHMIIHTKEKQFECDLCKKVFGRNDVLMRHMLTHSIQKPFECKECKLNFARNSQLMEHLRKRHQLKVEVGIEEKEVALLAVTVDEKPNTDVKVEEEKPKRVGRNRSIKKSYVDME